MVLAHVVLPSGSTSGGTRHTVVDTVFEVHWTHLLQTVVRDDVVAKHIHILLNHRTQILHQVLAVLHEVRVDIVLKSTYSIIVLDESAAGGFLHHVEHVLAVAHSIKEGGQRAQVLGTAGGEQQVAVQTLQLVHDGADVMDAVGELYAHRLLNHTYQCMALLHGTEVVKTIG